MRIRPLLLTIAIAVFGGVPAALAVLADPFGPVEVADPTWRPGSLFDDAAPLAGADGAGTCCWRRCSGTRSPTTSAPSMSAAVPRP